ncbi:hypothetical protein GJ654_20365 [Rhodoblastus acidophilus]|uniref:Uncharacterized protein n=1 Tax=Rhodoblastus acidophilus TaxID=1074 RepID=A0A6N8DWT8_RHOAC|nr:DUF6634 family protein [Rhodoblastus acidophilus]MCW2276529.1 hypothetical protein [Rhodoblastus acidophilus]MTV33334.1 hypothetical protein [Rhodoblastus acidophilus]
MDRILFPCLDADDTFRRAQRLADDLRRIAAGDLPTAADLADAPIIDHWSLALRPETSLVGVISGHPSIGHLRPGATTSLFAFAPDLGFARSWNRYYRLGRRVGDDGRPQ